MPLADVVRCAVSQATGIELSELTDATPIGPAGSKP
jgi:hypothetical protein